MRRLHNGYKRIGCLLLAFALVMAMLLPAHTQVSANTTQDNLTLHYEKEDDNGDTITVPNATFYLYRIADIGNDGSYTVTEPYADMPVDWSVLHSDEEGNWASLANTLRVLIIQGGRDKYPYDYTGKTDAGGVVAFKDVNYGLYLVVISMTFTEEETVVDGVEEDVFTIYEASPFLIVNGEEEEDESTEQVITHEYRIDKFNTFSFASSLFYSQSKEITVYKVWNDEGYGECRPEAVTVELYQEDGTLVDTVELNEGNDWRYSWTDLYYYTDYVVAEVVPDGYDVSFDSAVSNGVTEWVISNTVDTENPPETPEDETPSEEEETTPPDEEETQSEEESIPPTEQETTSGSESESTEITTPGEGESSGGSTGGGSDTTDEGKLPQTGLDWGPAAVLVLLGLLCMVIGMVKDHLGNREPKVRK